VSVSEQKRVSVIKFGFIGIFFGLSLITSAVLASQTVQLVVFQRTSEPIPETQNALNLYLGDITQGQVLLSVGEHTTSDIVKRISVTRGDIVRFEYQTRSYSMKILRLVNRLTGPDFAVIELTY